MMKTPLWARIIERLTDWRMTYLTPDEFRFEKRKES